MLKDPISEVIPSATVITPLPRMFHNDSLLDDSERGFTFSFGLLLINQLDLKNCILAPLAGGLQGEYLFHQTVLLFQEVVHLF